MLSGERVMLHCHIYESQHILKNEQMVNKNLSLGFSNFTIL